MTGMQVLVCMTGILFSIQLSAQSDLFRVEAQSSSYYYSTPTFEDQFRYYHHRPRIDLNFTEAAQKHLKTISLVDESGKTCYEWRLDSAGKMEYQLIDFSQSSYGISYEIEYTEERKHPFPSVIRCFRNDSLLRIDSMFYTTEEFGYKDTLCVCGITEIRRYKRGSLLNEQNQYYTDKYYREGKYSRINWNIAFDFGGALPELKEEKFRTDYPPDDFFYCHVLHTSEDRSDCNQCGRNSWSHGFPEEEYYEPVVMQQAMWCGNSRSWTNSFVFDKDSTGLPARFFTYSYTSPPAGYTPMHQFPEITSTDTTGMVVRYKSPVVSVPDWALPTETRSEKPVYTVRYQFWNKQE